MAKFYKRDDPQIDVRGYLMIYVKFWESNPLGNFDNPGHTQMFRWPSIRETYQAPILQGGDPDIWRYDGSSWFDWGAYTLGDTVPDPFDYQTITTDVGTVITATIEAYRDDWDPVTETDVTYPIRLKDGKLDQYGLLVATEVVNLKNHAGE